MDKNSEKKICQNCKKEFILDSSDQIFFEKFKVPSPNFCYPCRLQQRMYFRNQNKLYHRNNDAPDSDNNKIISIYSQDKKIKVYERDAWWGDSWDARDYGMNVDFSKPFFEQLKELIEKVPWPSLMNWNAVNSDYCNCTSNNKNCYLVFGGDFNEDCSYSTFNFHSRDSQDLYFVLKCDICYECIDCQNCYKLIFSQNCSNCLDSYFLYDCINCESCIGCTGLRNKQYNILNKQYSREEYLKLISEMKLNTRNGLKNFAKKFEQVKLSFPNKYAHIIKSVNCTGDNITGGRNCFYCFDIESDCEDLRYAYLVGSGMKDGYSFSHAGHGSELIYESFGVFSGARNVLFSIYSPSSQDIVYAYNCPSSSNLFGCVGMKKGSYSILNKQYSKEEYLVLVEKIKKHMDDMPYVDKKGRVFKFGDFWPYDLSYFSYNESIAQEIFPLTKTEANEKGFNWREQEARNYTPTIEAVDIPNSSEDILENITKEVFECYHSGKNCDHDCTTAFKMIPNEINLYKRLNLPLPTKCPNCRHYERLIKRNPLKLWHRKCMKKGCKNEFETSYAPERPEIVYCEKCYQQEVY